MFSTGVKRYLSSHWWKAENLFSVTLFLKTSPEQEFWEFCVRWKGTFLAEKTVFQKKSQIFGPKKADFLEEKEHFHCLYFRLRIGMEHRSWAQKQPVHLVLCMISGSERGCVCVCVCNIILQKINDVEDSGCQQRGDSRATFSSSGTGGGQGEHRTYIVSRSQIHKRTISLRFLGIILRVLGLEVSGTMLHYKPVSSHFCSSVGGGGWVRKWVSIV